MREPRVLELGMSPVGWLGQSGGMNTPDYSGFAVPIVLALVAVLLNGLFFYAVITAAVQGALKKHYFWVRRQEERTPPPRRSLAD